jgi:hypothetical protein
VTADSNAAKVLMAFWHESVDGRMTMDEIQQFRDEQGLDLIAQALGVPRPQRPLR